jgi:hypothetical protein
MVAAVGVFCAPWLPRPLCIAAANSGAKRIADVIPAPVDQRCLRTARQSGAGPDRLTRRPIGASLALRVTTFARLSGLDHILRRRLSRLRAAAGDARTAVIIGHRPSNNGGQA